MSDHRIGDVPKGDRECSKEDLQAVRDFAHQARAQELWRVQGFKHGKAGGLPLESSEQYWVGYARGKRELANTRKQVGLCPCCGDLHK